MRDLKDLEAPAPSEGTWKTKYLEEVARRNGLALSWHRGFALPADQVPEAFRGPEARALGLRLAAEEPGPLHAARIGRAAASVVREPARWADHAPPADTRGFVTPLGLLENRFQFARHLQTLGR